ncbi:MAG: hypothetical protein JNG85_10105 [Spirochaetaceae bacterium]|nr:hypothetical protein [Spirochaetaceae bacterium]
MASVLALWAPAFSWPQAAAAPSPVSTSELARLAEISTRLGALNERLKSELADSKRSSTELAALLESSRLELEDLRSELESSRRISTELGERAASSASELTGLRTALTKADDSLRNLESSFEAYRRAAEATIRRVELGRTAAVAAAAAGWLAALGLFLFR